MSERTWVKVREALKFCSENIEESSFYIDKACYEKSLEIVDYMERLKFPIPRFFTLGGEAVVFEWEEEEISIFKPRDKSKIMAYVVITEDEPPKKNKFTLTFR